MLGKLAGTVTVAGAAVAAFAVAETRRFELRQTEVPVLPRGADPVRVLHLSDIHLTPTQRSQA